MPAVHDIETVEEAKCHRGIRMQRRSILRQPIENPAVQNKSHHSRAQFSTRPAFALHRAKKIVGDVGGASKKSCSRMEILDHSATQKFDQLLEV